MPEVAIWEVDLNGSMCAWFLDGHIGVTQAGLRPDDDLHARDVIVVRLLVCSLQSDESHWSMMDAAAAPYNTAL